MPHATGDRLNASDLNLHAAKYASLAAQTIANTTLTKIVLATLRYNYGTAITINSPTFTELTLTRTGLYAIGGGLQMAGMNNELYVWVGNSASTTPANRFAQQQIPNLSGDLPSISVSVDHYFSAGDKISLWCWHNHGSARDTTVTADILPYLYARYLGDG
ncbi:MAG: hypothetical protein ABW224_17635 [Kibdelosporangium sp.]